MKASLIELGCRRLATSRRSAYTPARRRSAVTTTSRIGNDAAHVKFYGAAGYSFMRYLRFSLVMLFAIAMQAGDAPERVVRDNVITSLRDPKVTLRLPASAKYCGADRWDLFDIADCELHAFVDADQQQKVQRIYWIQFEQYLPSKFDLHHQYDSPRHATIGGLDFYVDTQVASADKKPKAGSDGEHIRALIGRSGYKLPPETMYVRLVHLLDEAKRKELMIIYAEDLSGTGFSAADLRAGGRAHDQWPKIEEGLIERAKAAIVLGPVD